MMCSSFLASAISTLDMVITPIERTEINCMDTKGSNHQILAIHQVVFAIRLSTKLASNDLTDWIVFD
jgi:hypothetical protein